MRMSVKNNIFHALRCTFKSGFLLILLAVFAQPAFAQITNPFQKENSKLYRQLEEKEAAPQRQSNDSESLETPGTTPPPGRTGNLPFDVSPQLLRQLQPQEEKDYGNIFASLAIVGIKGENALIKNNEHYYFVKDGDSFTHEGNILYTEVSDQLVRILSPLGTEIYVGSVGSGLRTETDYVPISNTSSSSGSSNSSRQ